MSSEKKAIRKYFRDEVFKRDGFRCAMCGKKSSKDNIENEMDAHHITDRNLLPNGGYVKENGITLCTDECHEKAEVFHSTGTSVEGYSPEDLYKKINSSYEKAVEASQELDS
jgi:predicted restriction endonuclease